MKKLLYISAIALFFSFFISCKKDKPITSSSAKLSFSQDSLLFDTVFTSIGSTTKLFRIHNRNNGKLIISSLKLARGTNSFFRLNVDGVAGKSFSNLEIAAQDSMYIFVEVTIDPTFDPSVSPFIYKDSILFEINGNQQHFNLIAFGQNAYYYMRDKKIYDSHGDLALYYDTLPNTPNSSGSYTMKNDKPHLIYGQLVVDSSQTLNIQDGAKIYLHDGGQIWVYQYGNIHINGTQNSEVTFQGDRLEQEYKDVPGQWDRIWINEGGVNTISYAVIKNAYIGIQAGYAAFGGYPLPYNAAISTSLKLDHTIIQNCSGIGLLAQGYTVTGGDNVVVNCGQSLCEFDYGGKYVFYQSTFANYWAQTNNSSSSSSRTTPSFAFNNYFNGNIVSPFDSLYFGNCILDGSLAEEFQFDTIAGGFSNRSAFAFNYCALKTGSLPQNTNPSHTCQTSQTNLNMKFINPTIYNFDITITPPYSAAYQAGSVLFNGGYTTDIKGNPPTGTNPNMGAYQQ